jgi:hypothetical protein
MDQSLWNLYRIRPSSVPSPVSSGRLLCLLALSSLPLLLRLHLHRIFMFTFTHVTIHLMLLLKPSLSSGSVEMPLTPMGLRWPEECRKLQTAHLLSLGKVERTRDLASNQSFRSSPSSFLLQRRSRSSASFPSRKSAKAKPMSKPTIDLSPPKPPPSVLLHT